MYFSFILFVNFARRSVLTEATAVYDIGSFIFVECEALDTVRFRV